MGITWDPESYYIDAQIQIGWARDFLFKNYSFSGQERVLDIGCGDGRISKLISSQVPHGQVIGIDNSESMVNFAKSSNVAFSNLEFLLEDASNSLFYDEYKEYFDLVVSFSALHWVKDQKSILKKIYKVLKHGGKFYFRIAAKNEDPVEDIADQLMKKTPYSKYFKNFSNAFFKFSLEEYNFFLRDSNLNVISSKSVILKDIVPNRTALLNQNKIWLPNYHHLKHLDKNIAEQYINEVTDIYIKNFPSFEKAKAIILYDHYLEIIGSK